MKKRRAAWLVRALCALVVGLDALGLTLTFAGPNTPRLGPALVKTLLEAVVPVVFGGVVALIVAHQPRNTIGRLLMVIVLGWTTAAVITSSLPLPTTAILELTPAMLLNVWFS